MTKRSACRITFWFFLMAAALNLASFGQRSGSRNARVMAFPVTQASLGFTGEWSDGSSWLTIIKDGDKFVGIYPSGKDVEVLRGEILPNRQLKLVTVRYGKLFNPLQSYEGDFDNQAWLELGSDQNSLTVRFNETRGGRSLILKRVSGGSTAKRSEPETARSAVASISVGTSHTCYVTMGGAGYCWGDGKGANGNGTTARTPAPAPIVGDLNLSSASSGYYFTCWVTTDGSAYCAGSNENGQLGNGKPRVGTERGSEYIDSAVPTAVAGGLKFSIVSVGQQHACGLTTAGAAYCWGDNSHEQLGNIDKVWTTNDSQFIDNRYGSKSADSSKPFPVGGGLLFATLSAGAAHTCAVTPTGAAYCWGEGSHGELGNGGKARSARPVAVAGGLSFASLTASKTSTFTCGLTTSGTAYCWGLVDDNDNMQLGNGQTGSSLVPVAVAGGLSFTVLSAGAEHVCGITTGGAAYCWGTGGWGLLGTGTEKDA